jgi:hypothetical protein
MAHCHSAFAQVAFQDLVAVFHRVVETDESGQHFGFVFVLKLGELGDIGFLGVLQDKLSDFDADL